MNMNKNDTMKYVGAALAIGGSMLLGSGIMTDSKSMKKKLRKTASKAIDAFDGVINGVQNFVK